MASYDIFISYRRTDSKGAVSGTNIARSIKQQLEIDGYNDRVFFDYSEITDGEFEKTILPAIEGCKVLLLVLSKEALMRCVNVDDWVRREIIHAVEHNVKIIPVEPDYQFDGYPEGFPQELDVIRREQHTRIHMDSSFETDVQKMIDNRISKVVAPFGFYAHQQPSHEMDAIIHVETDMDCDVFSFGHKVGFARTNDYSVIHLKKGKHKLEFRSVENPSDFQTLVYEVEDNNMEDFIPVRLIPERNRRLEAERKAWAASEKKERNLRNDGAKPNRTLMIVLASVLGFALLALIVIRFSGIQPAEESVEVQTPTPAEIYDNAKGLLDRQMYAEALPLLDSAAAQGYAMAQYSLGVCYENGYGVDKDYSQAFDCYQKAAGQGIAEAQSSLGFCYSEGIGVKKDLASAFHWYLEAAEQGHATSQYNVGVFYSRGLGVNQNHAEAAKWYLKVADQGYATAQLALGMYYEKGLGVDKDYSKAAEWYGKAAAQGDENAKKALARLNM